MTTVDLDVDLADAATYVDGVPHDTFARLRREAPVYAHPHPQGGHFWCVTRHDDIVHVNRDAATYSSYEGAVFIQDMGAEGLDQLRLMMLNLDPPDHTKLRKIVNKGFTPRSIEALAARLREITTDIVDRVVERGACDFVTDVAAELPLQAIAEIMGVPVEDRHMIFDWSNRMIGSEDPEFNTTPEEAQGAATELFLYSQQLAEKRRADPQDDIVSTLLVAEVDGHRLSDVDFNSFFLLLAVAGNETTRNAISHGMHFLMEHTDQRRILLEDPSLVDLAVEEILRYSSPVMQFRRTATRDTEIGGVPIASGDRVVMWHISGNRDEDVFDEPNVFDVRRDPNLHLQQIAFGGGGPHFCLGANLARVEMKIMFEEVLTRIPTMEPAGEPVRLRSNLINGLKHLPVRW